MLCRMGGAREGLQMFCGAEWGQGAPQGREGSGNTVGCGGMADRKTGVCEAPPDWGGGHSWHWSTEGGTEDPTEPWDTHTEQRECRGSTEISAGWRAQEAM